MRALLVLTLAACGPSMAQQRETARAAVSALQGGRFDVADRESELALQKDPTNPEAHAVRALTRYKSAIDDVFEDARVAVLSAVLSGGGFHYKRVRERVEATARTFAAIDQDLAVAADAEWITLELCPACWEVDWNHNGEVDARDGRLLEVERDGSGNELPEGDPRRRPTFRFDQGDLSWARALLAFQRAAIEVAMAYEWDNLGAMVMRLRGGGAQISIKLSDPKRMTAAKRLLLDALGYSGRSREVYLAETDDDREWLPNPRQTNHPLPLPVDDALYETWRGALTDLELLIEGKTGLDVQELARLAKGDDEAAHAPPGFIDIGSMLSRPKDLVIDTAQLRGLRNDTPALVKATFGSAFVVSMPASGILARVARMKSEITRGEDTWARKVRYLLWIN